nr:M23 family metallopeptidase [Corynebacterium ulceribovis]
MAVQTRRGGKHRKQVTSTATKGRVTVVALATGAASVASAGVAKANAEENEQAQIQQAPTLNGAQDALTDGFGSAPQVLNIAQPQDLGDLQSQLNKALKFTEQRLLEDSKARAPKTAKPAAGSFTSGFGMRWGSMHNGVDIANAIGTPILAVMAGTVIDSGPASGYGNWIRIRHNDGSVSVYGHMETLDVSVGEQVYAGQKIAGMGSRGFSTGSHLHFEIHPDGNTPVDPKAWLEARGISL